MSALFATCVPTVSNGVCQAKRILVAQWEALSAHVRRIFGEIVKS